MASINDVAEKAGVSISTVSRVLNNHPNVSEEKKEAVKNAVAELDYIPNALARGLVTQNTYSIGVLISDIANDFYSILVRSMEDVLNSRGYFTVIGNTDWEKGKEKKYIKYFRQKQVDGLILASTTLEKSEIREFSRELPVVILDRDIDNENIDRIRIDDCKGGYLAASHLLAAGYKKLVHIKGPRGIASAEDREAGFLQAVKEEAVSDKRYQIIAGHYTEKAGYDAVKNYLRKKPEVGKGEGSIGFFAANDAMALGVLKYLNQNNISCPEAIGVAGFDDVGLAAYTNPPLTSVRRPICEIGKLAAKMLLEHLESEGDNEDYFNRDVQLDVRLIKRESTALGSSCKTAVNSEG